MMSKELDEEKDTIYVSGYAYTSVRDRFRDVLDYGEEEKETSNKAQEQEKVLEIIKEKKIVDIKWLKASRNYKEYNSKILDIYNDLSSLLTEEEFELLKRYFE